LRSKEGLEWASRSFSQLLAVTARAGLLASLLLQVMDKERIAERIRQGKAEESPDSSDNEECEYV
jgi:hypothetical protein